MLNNFIYAKTKDLFIEQLEAHQILDEAIVFIEDTKEIWNHGTYFAGISDSGLDQETIDQINAEIENVRNSIPSPKDNYIDFNTGAENVTVTENEHGMMNIIVTNDVILNATGLSPLEFKNGIDNGKQLRMIYDNAGLYPYATSVYPLDNSGTSLITSIYDIKTNNPPEVVLCYIQMGVENEEIVIAGQINGFPYATMFPGIATTDQLDNKIVFDYASLGLPNESEYVLTDDQVMTACGMSATNLYNKVTSGTEVAFKGTSSEGMETVLLATNVHMQENWFAINFVNLDGGYILMYDNGTISVMFDYTLGYQPTLVSGTNIKTINGQTLLGEGDITISTDVDLTDYALKVDIPTTTSQLTNNSGFLTEHQDISGKQDLLVSGTNIKTINGDSILGEGDLEIKATIEGDFATVEDYGSEVIMPVSNIVSMSQEEYDALTEKNSNTIYLIV